MISEHILKVTFFTSLSFFFFFCTQLNVSFNFKQFTLALLQFNFIWPIDKTLE